METEKKSHKGIKIIIGLILIVGGFFVGYNFDKIKTTFDEKILKKETPKEEKKEEPIEQEEKEPELKENQQFIDLGSKKAILEVDFEIKEDSIIYIIETGKIYIDDKEITSFTKNIDYAHEQYFNSVEDAQKYIKEVDKSEFVKVLNDTNTNDKYLVVSTDKLIVYDSNGTKREELNNTPLNIQPKFEDGSPAPGGGSYISIKVEADKVGDRKTYDTYVDEEDGKKYSEIYSGQLTDIHEDFIYFIEPTDKECYSDPYKEYKLTITDGKVEKLSTGNTFEDVLGAGASC